MTHSKSQPRLDPAKHLAVLCAVALATLAGGFAAEASAGTGGAKYWSASTGGSNPVEPAVPTANERKAAKRKRAAARRAPVLTGFKLSSTTLLAHGRPLTLRYRVKAGAKRVRVRLIVRTARGKYVKTAQLGVHRTTVLQTTKLTQEELGVKRAGRYKLRLVVRDGRGRKAARAAGVRPWLRFNLSAHRFPVVGLFSFGGDDARFGAGRPGHKHQGQDVVADEGTPLVAPHAGTISWVRYQADGAGYYVVLDGRDGRDYVFMHLKKGSINVKQGDVVPTGKLLGRVGSTGRSSGPHLHFEIWTGGPWQFGGKPVDPLPLLKSWFASAPGGATQLGTARSTKLSRKSSLSRRSSLARSARTRTSFHEHNHSYHESFDPRNDRPVSP
ncbi:MAG: M23 family metallopeptidase [Solirubrobacterales bacterium]